MITLTKEWLLKTIAELEEERDATPGAVNEDAANALAAMKLALESLEAESEPKQPELSHVIYHFRDWNEGFPIERFKADYVISWMLANYPPAQPTAVSVPDDVTAEDCPAFIKYDLTQVDEAWARGFNTCRAAMLQGAEPVTTAYKLPFEQWLSQQTGTIDVECGCVMTEVFFHWLRVAYEAGNYPVIPDGWVACSERLPPEGYEPDGGAVCYLVWHKNEVDCGPQYSISNVFFLRKHWEKNFTHWMPLPAAPQQEVTQALAKGMERYGDAMQELAKKEVK